MATLKTLATIGSIALGYAAENIDHLSLLYQPLVQVASIGHPERALDGENNPRPDYCFLPLEAEQSTLTCAYADQASSFDSIQVAELASLASN